MADRNTLSNGRTVGTRIKGITPGRIDTAKYVKGRQDSKIYSTYKGQNERSIKSSPVNRQISRSVQSSQRNVSIGGYNHVEA